jgi:hypothetical protein|eukprot:COSAG01_NODE_1993_length_8694_cov_3.220826_6_plen_88_part_00
MVLQDYQVGQPDTIMAAATTYPGGCRPSLTSHVSVGTGTDAEISDNFEALSCELPWLADLALDGPWQHAVVKIEAAARRLLTGREIS